MSTTETNRTGMRSWRSRVGLMLVTGTLAASAIVTPAMLEAPGTSASAISNWSDGGTTVSGRSWLKRAGVSVYRGRQCTELASRLYATKRWGHISSFYNMRAKRRYGPLQFFRNGSRYRPVPGDVLVELGGPWQHVAVVDRVVRGRIYTVEQNAAANGRHTYYWNGRWATGAYRDRFIGGYIHSRKNPFKR